MLMRSRSVRILILSWTFSKVGDVLFLFYVLNGRVSEFIHRLIWHQFISKWLDVNFDFRLSLWGVFCSSDVSAVYVIAVASSAMLSHVPGYTSASR